MSHSSSVGFLVFALCLVACVFASATVEVAEKDQARVYTIYLAKQAVEDAIKSIKEVSDKAQGNINNATVLLQKVEKFKTQAEESQSKAIEVEENNKDAAGNVNKIKSTFNEVSKLHQSAKEKLEKTISSLGELLEEAEKVKVECDTELLLIKKAAEEYKDTKKKVPDLLKKVGQLKTNIINILANMNDVQSTPSEMEKKLKEALPANLHVNVIVAISKIGAIISNADTIIDDTQNKKNEVNKIVQEMQILKTTATSEAIADINKIWKASEDELTKATGALDNAKETQKEMKKQKQLAAAALTNVQKTETDLIKAQQDADTAQNCVVKVKQFEGQLQTALETAKNAVTNAKELKQKLVTALSTTTTAPNTEQTTEAKKFDPPLADGTGTDQKDATTQPTITNTKQPTSKDSLGQTDKSAEKLKDALSKGAQNVPTTALTGGKAPAPGAKNDSAMTVSVSLLVALIASAVLQ